jgi:hypothetical protein
MTAAGVATLFITEEMLYPRSGLDCRGNIYSRDIERGLQWITDHMDHIGPKFATYTWYGIERIGAASGRKYFGSVDWYAAGAERLCKSQQADGSWTDFYTNADIPSTAFAMLFLVRGRSPVMMGKLQYHLTPAGSSLSSEASWNQRPRDVANLARWVGKGIEHDLNWQIIPIDASLADMHDAPVLYISGDQPLSFTPEEETKLRDYVQTGGMILANADCGIVKKEFAASFEALGKRLFPGRAFVDLPANHPIFTGEQYLGSRWKPMPRLRGLSNGIRELMVLIPSDDPALNWQSRPGHQVDAAFQHGAQLFL